MRVTGQIKTLLVFLTFFSLPLLADISEWCPEGSKAYRSGDSESASLALSNCLYSPPEDPELASEGYAMRGETYFSQGDYQAAVSDYDLAVELWPENATAWRSKARVHFQLEDYLEAISAINRSLDINSNDTESHFVHATILTAMDRPDLAMDAYDLAFSFESRQNVQKLQQALESEGFRIGSNDGVYGVRTRNALKECIAAGCALSLSM